MDTPRMRAITAFNYGHRYAHVTDRNAGGTRVAGRARHCAPVCSLPKSLHAILATVEPAACWALGERSVSRGRRR